MTLDTQTAVRLSSGDKLETLRLLKGRLFAQVREGTGRRFLVETPFGTALAKGTAYVVEQNRDAMVVTVTESVVRVCSRSALDCMDARPGDRVTVTASGRLTTDRVDAASSTRWLSGWIDAADRDLGDVIAELNPYLETPFTLQSPLSPP